MTANMAMPEMVSRGDVEVSMTISDVDVQVDNIVLMPFESVPRLIDIIIRLHRYSVVLLFRSSSSSLNDSFDFHYHPPSTIGYAISGAVTSSQVNNGLLGTAGRLRDMADFVERLQREVGIQGSRIYIRFS